METQLLFQNNYNTMKSFQRENLEQCRLYEESKGLGSNCTIYFIYF